MEYDSRRVGAGDVFVAMRGGTTDGNRYIDAAVAQGAAAVVTDSREAFDAAAAGASGDWRWRWWSMGGARWRRLARRCLGIRNEAEGERGDGDEREDDDGVSAGADAAERGAEVRADWDD